MKKKSTKPIRTSACFLAAACALTFSSCSALNGLLGGLLSETEEALQSTESSSETYEIPETSVYEELVTPEASAEPDPDKVVEREEIDAIGHKFVYYTDGTYEDLGRVTPLDFSTPAPSSQYGYRYFASQPNGKGLCGFYVDLYNAATAIHASEQNYGKNDDGYVEGKSLSFSDDGLTSEQAISVWKIFIQENPAFFWIDSQILYGESTLVLLIDETYALGSARQTAKEAVYEMAFECDGYLSGKTSLAERALTVHDYLAWRIEYAYEADGVTPEDAEWAHNIVGGALYDAGVCETYAKTFDYFCDLFGLECLTVTGTAMQDGEGGAHAWNMLKLGGEWYAVDVTWSDQTQLNREWFGKAAAEFKTTHTADASAEWGVAYQYEFPALSSSALCPVLYGEENGGYEMAGSIDEAFEKMQNEAGRYEIILYPDTKITAEKGMDILLQGASFSADIPKVAHLQFTGEKVKTGFLSYELSPLSANEVTLNANVTMQYVQFSYTKLNKNGYTLTSVTR